MFCAIVYSFNPIKQVLHFNIVEIEAEDLRCYNSYKQAAKQTVNIL